MLTRMWLGTESSDSVRSGVEVRLASRSGRGEAQGAQEVGGGSFHAAAVIIKV